MVSKKQPADDDEYVDFGVKVNYQPLPPLPEPSRNPYRVLEACEKCGRIGYLADYGYGKKVCAYGGCRGGY